MFTKLAVWLHVALNDRKGVSSMEYAVLAAAIIVAVGAAAKALGSGIENAMNTLVTTLQNAM